MADDVNANIRIDLDTSEAVVALKNLQAQISSFNQSVIKSNATAVAAQQSMLSTLTAQIGASRQFTTSMVNVETSVSKLGNAIDKNKLSLGEYFRYGVASSRTFGRMFGREHNAIMELAADRVKRLQTQYIAMGEAQNGVTRAMAVRPVGLFNADMAVGIQRQQLFNKLLHDGSTSLVNWGKNTQWAGRQLMVGFTVPLTIFGGIAGQVFMDLERQIVNFRRVYGDATTPLQETDMMIEQIKELGSEFTKYGIAVKDTITLASDAAAAGAQGANLLAQTEQATRLATLGMMDQQQALTATIALQSAFQMNSTELAESIDFLNAVENQTVLSLQDVAEAIPKVAPVIQGLGGDVQDLAIFLAAMREGGVSAAEGANALKSGLASLINPTKNAREQLEKVGIDIDAILKTNKGDLRGIVTEFGTALSTLGKFQRQQTLAKVFGKYQFARLGALFENVSRQGSQANRVVDLTGASLEELGALAEKELGAISDSVGVKFTGAVERLKLAIAPIGEAFLRVATPIVEFATKILEKFNELSPSAKNIAIVLATGLGVVVPTVTMLIGLFANFAGQAVKGIAIFTNFFSRLRNGGAALNYLSEEQLDAMAAAASLEGRVDSLTTSLNVQAGAVRSLSKAYGVYVASAKGAAANLPQGFRGRNRKIPGMATGGFVAGTGNKDSEPVMLMPGEFVVNKKAAQEYGPVLSAMNSGTLRGLAEGSDPIVSSLYSDIMLRLQKRTENMAQKASLPGIEDILSVLSLRVGESRGVKPTQARVQAGAFDPIAAELEGMAEEFVGRMGVHFDDTYASIEDSNERLRRAWTDAGIEMEGTLSRFTGQAEERILRQYMGLEEDIFGTVATDVRREGETRLSRARKGVAKGTGTRSYMDVAAPARLLYERRTGRSAAELQMGHVLEPRDISLSQLQALATAPEASSGVKAASRKAGSIVGQQLDDGARAQIGAASPAKDGQKLVEDYVDGMTVGAKQNIAEARQSGAAVKAAFVGGAAGVPGMTPGFAAMAGAAGAQMGQMPAGPTSPIEMRKVPATQLGMGGGDGPEGPVKAVGGAADDASEGMDKAERSSRRLSTSFMSLSMGATTVAGGLSMMDNEVGQTARNMLPFLAALDAVGLGMTLLDGKWGKVGAGFQKFGSSIKGMGAGLVAFLGKIPFVGKFASIFQKLGGVVARVVGVFMKFSGLRAIIGVLARVAAFLGPQGIIAGIIALGVALFEIYRKFETFRKAVSDLGASLVELFEMIFGPTDELGGKLSSLGETISSVWNGVLRVLEPIFRTIVKVIEILVKTITLAIFAFKEIVNWVSTNFPQIADTVLDSLGPVGTFLREFGGGIQKVFAAIPGFIADTWTNILTGIESAVNTVIGWLNILIDKARELGADIERLDTISLVGGGVVGRGTGGLQAQAEKNAVIAAERARDRQRGRLAREMADRETGDGDGDGEGSGEKEKTFFQKLAEDTDANYKLFVENIKKSGKSAMDQLRAISPPIPEQILAMIGVGPEGLKNAQEVLNADAKKRKVLFDRWTKATIGQTLTDLRARTEAKKQEGNARAILQARGVEKNLIDQILQDQNNVLTIVSGTKEEIKETIDAYRQLQEEQDPIEQAVKNIKKAHEETVKVIDKEIDKQQEIVNGIEDQISALEEKNAEDQWAIRNKEREKELIDRQIESLERANEMDQRRIENLQRQDELRNRESEALSRELEQLSSVEEQIRQSYQERIAALDKVAEINSFIVNQQRQQLGLSQALSQGDIFAATAAAQEMRQSQTEFAQQQARAGLEQGMETAVTGLRTAGGLTRAQAEQQINQIKEQSYQTSLQIRDIEDQIFARNEQIVPLKDQQYQIDLQIRDLSDQIFNKETEIYNIRKTQLEPAQQILDNLNEQKMQMEKVTDETINQIQSLAELADAGKDVTGQVDNIAAAWYEVQKAIKRANELARQQSDSLIMPVRQKGETAVSYADRLARVQEQRSRIAAEREAAVNSALAQGRATMGMYGGGRVSYKGSNEPPPAQMMGGGKVMRYGMGKKVMGYAAGNIVGAGTRDSVPAMLTPGEFVVRKAMVDKYGAPMLQKINQGAFSGEGKVWAGGTPDFDETTGKYRRRAGFKIPPILPPRFNVPKERYRTTPVKDSNQQVVAPMYNNYSVNVSVSGTNASADEIANRTIMKIKQMQDMQIRSGRGY